MPNDMTPDALVIFTPSGKRGRFALGTPVLTAARQLGVDLDSVCGGRGICSKCQITPGYGEFAKHGLTVEDGALSDWNEVEARYKRIRGLVDGRRETAGRSFRAARSDDFPEMGVVRMSAAVVAHRAADIFRHGAEILDEFADGFGIEGGFAFDGGVEFVNVCLVVLVVVDLHRFRVDMGFERVEGVAEVW